MTVEHEPFRARILHLKNPWGPDKLDYVCLIEVRKFRDGTTTYSLGSLSTIPAEDCGREKTKEVIVICGGIDHVERTDR